MKTARPLDAKALRVRMLVSSRVFSHEINNGEGYIYRRKALQRVTAEQVEDTLDYDELLVGKKDVYEVGATITTCEV